MPSTLPSSFGGLLGTGMTHLHNPYITLINAIYKTLTFCETTRVEKDYVRIPTRACLIERWTVETPIVLTAHPHNNAKPTETHAFILVTVHAKRGDVGGASRRQPSRARARGHRQRAARPLTRVGSALPPSAHAPTRALRGNYRYAKGRHLA